VVIKTVCLEFGSVIYFARNRLHFGRPSLFCDHGAMAFTSHPSSPTTAAVIAIVSILLCALIFTIGLVFWRRGHTRRCSIGSKEAGNHPEENRSSSATNRSLQLTVRDTELGGQSGISFINEPLAIHEIFRGGEKGEIAGIAKTFLGIDNASILCTLVAHQGIYKSDSNGLMVTNSHKFQHLSPWPLYTRSSPPRPKCAKLHHQKQNR
jgi:hypothetical protein